MIFKVDHTTRIEIGMQLIVATSVKICFINGKKIYDFIKYHNARVEELPEEIIPGSGQLAIKMQGIPIPVRINFLAVEGSVYKQILNVLSQNKH